jgi:hypothetical protein
MRKKAEVQKETVRDVTQAEPAPPYRPFEMARDLNSIADRVRERIDVLRREIAERSDELEVLERQMNNSVSFYGEVASASQKPVPMLRTANALSLH